MKKSALALVMAGVLGATTVSAETWNMATPYPEGNFHTKNIRWFVDEVEKATGGELTIEVHSGASLFPMAQIKRALRTGQVQMAEFLISAYGNEDAIYEADSIPFFTGAEEGMKLYEVQKPMLDERFAKEGIVAIYSVPWPRNGLYTQSAFTSVDQFKGVRMRAQTAVLARLAELLAASPVDVQFVEVPQAFQTGVVEAMWTSGTTGVDTQAWDYTKYFYDIAVVSPRNVVAVNQDAWESLSEETRAKVMEIAAQAEARGWQEANDLAENAKKTLLENGMEAPEMTPELAAALQEVGGAMVKEWIEKAGPDGEALARALGKLPE